MLRGPSGVCIPEALLDSDGHLVQKLGAGAFLHWDWLDGATFLGGGSSSSLLGHLWKERGVGEFIFRGDKKTLNLFEFVCVLIFFFLLCTFVVLKLVRKKICQNTQCILLLSHR